MGVEPENGYIKDPKGSIQKIKTVVEAAIGAGIYVIIDWHSHNVNLAEAKVFSKRWPYNMVNIPISFMNCLMNQTKKAGPK